MMLRRVEAATVFPVTLEQAKAQCRVDAGDDDELIGALIAAANETVGEMTGLVLGAETWDQTVTDPTGAVRLLLEPIAELVSINGASADDYALDTACRTVTGPWPAGEVVIRFVAGGEDAPGLRQALLMLVAQWYLHREATSETEQRPVPLSVQALVDLHRRGWVKA